MQLYIIDDCSKSDSYMGSPYFYHRLELLIYLLISINKK